MNMFFTSDLHFYHKSILSFAKEFRPFQDLDEMRQHFIDEINATCQPTDILYHLGDLYFGKSPEQLREILSEIKCRLHFIRGNHDHNNNVKVMREFGHVEDYLELKVNGTKLILCHYPLTFWNSAHYGSSHLFGHMHGRYQAPGRAIDVGWDAHGKILSIEEALELCRAKPIHEVY